MNKARLEELRERVFFDYQEWDIKCSKDGFQEASPTGEMDADGKDLTALIDAEIARQSVTDEAVQKAIEQVENIKEYLLSEAQSEQHTQVTTDDDMALDLAITALQAYQLPSAIKWTGDNLREVINLTGWNESASSKWTWEEYEQVVAEKWLKVFTPDGSVMAEIGDWIIENGKDCFVTRQYQKPTDEAVRDAISWLESDKIDRQREWEKQDTEWKLEQGAKEMHDSFMSAFDLAIQALRQTMLSK